MCGIAGVIRLDRDPVAMDLLRTMARRLAHRGPDDEDFWVSEDRSVAFAHRRLSIIDLAASRQPMSSPDGRLHISFNGEILNYRELRNGLNYPFRTSGDTEVLLAMHNAHGVAGISRLTGQYAYAVHDAATGEVLLVRDRLGILPLFYYVDKHFVVFASEIKALLPAMHDVKLEEGAIAEYLRQRYVRSPRTLFAGIRKVRPGHMLRISRTGINQERYWHPQLSQRPKIEPADAVTRLREVLCASVDRNLVADVPVGAFLSGGVDSSLIVALIRSLRPRETLKTFAAGFQGDRLNELPFASRVAHQFGTDHHEIHLGPDDFADCLPRLTWHRDAPISEPSDIAVNQLANLAAREVKVVVTGEGSDELFGGYPKYQFAAMSRWAGTLPYRMRQPSFHLLQRRLPPSRQRLRTAVRALAQQTEEQRYEMWFGSFATTEVTQLMRAQSSSTPTNDAPQPRTAFRRMQALDLIGWLPDNLLERADRMSMAESLETRPPFLDNDVVDFSLSLPVNVLNRHGTRKWAVRELAATLLPRDLIERPKVGFRVPLDTWFRGGLREMAWDLLTSPSSLSSSIFDKQPLQDLLTRHERGEGGEEKRIWTLVALEVWHQVFFKDYS